MTEPSRPPGAGLPLPADGATLPELLAMRAATAPDALAMRRFTASGVQEITWAESLRTTSYLAAALGQRGLEAGDVVVVVGPPAPEMFWAAYAAWTIGAAVVGMWPGADDDAVAQLAMRTSARVILSTDGRQAQSLAASVAALGRPPLVVDAAGLAEPGTPATGALAVAELFEEGKEGAGAAALAAAKVSPDSPAAFFRTSGSTGEPKIAAHTHASLIAGTRIFLAGFPAGADDDHVPNFNLAAPAEPVVGTVNHLLTGVRMNFSAPPIGYEELIRKVSPVYLWTMPPTWQQRAGLVRKALDEESLEDAAARQEAARRVLGAARTRWALTGGTALSADVIQLLQSIGLPLFKIYASSEMLITMSGLCDPAVTDGIGAPLPGVEAAIDESGQLCITSAGLFTGYDGNPGATAGTLTADGWYLTGDAAWIDDSGEFRFIGRMSDLTRREDGSVMSPQLVESRLKDSRFIAEAVVVSAPSGGSVLALIDVDTGMLRAEPGGQGPGAPAGAEDLLGSARVAELIDAAVTAANAGLPPGSRVSRYACLRTPLSAGRDELTATGKVRRAVVIEHYRHLIDELGASTTSGRPAVGRPVQP
jgi:long-chain acyl-CoA synthetase